MVLTLDYQTVQTTPRQQSLDLLDQLAYLSVALRQLWEHKQLLREEKNALLAQQRALFKQQQAMSTEESILLQEESAILAELAFLRKQC